MADIPINVEEKNSKELLNEGIRSFILQNYSSAVSALSKASELLVAEHNSETHESLGEVYLYYGKALLSLYRAEAEALGEGVPKNNEDDDDDDDEETETANEGGENNDIEENEANEGNGDTNQEDKETGAKTKEESTEVKEDSSETKEESTEKEVKSTEQKDTAGPSGSGAESTEEKPENEDDLSDLQVAWEVLELAKSIYKEKGAAGKKYLAETLSALGEISLENGNFQAAVNDMEECLELQKDLFGPDSRTIAETLYKLGVAYCTNAQVDKAIASFKQSVKYLKNRIHVLKVESEMQNKENDEIAEIQDLLPDLEEKVSDLESDQREAIKSLAAVLNQPKKEESTSAGSSKQASDISHLVKRKRKVDDILEEKSVEGSPAKKPSP